MDEAKATILIVEDEPALRELLSLALRRAGYRVEAVADGPAALDWIRDRVLSPVARHILERFPEVVQAPELSVSIVGGVVNPTPAHPPPPLVG